MSTNKHRQSATIISLLLPLIFACTHAKAHSWLRENWNKLVSFVQIFDKKNLQLHVSSDLLRSFNHRLLSNAGNYNPAYFISCISYPTSFVITF